MGNNLPSFECAKRIAYVVADELKKGDEISQPSLVIVADRMTLLFACATRKEAFTNTLNELTTTFSNGRETTGC